MEEAEIHLKFRGRRSVHRFGEDVSGLMAPLTSNGSVTRQCSSMKSQIRKRHLYLENHECADAICKSEHRGGAPKNSGLKNSLALREGDTTN